jgi:hypothetical protein
MKQPPKSWRTIKTQSPEQSERKEKKNYSKQEITQKEVREGREGKEATQKKNRNGHRLLRLHINNPTLLEILFAEEIGIAGVSQFSQALIQTCRCI